MARQPWCVSISHAVLGDLLLQRNGLVDLAVIAVEVVNVELACESQSTPPHRSHWRQYWSAAITSSTRSTGLNRRRCESRTTSGLPPFSSRNKLMSSIGGPAKLKNRNLRKGTAALTQKRNVKLFLFGFIAHMGAQRLDSGRKLRTTGRGRNY